LRKEEKIICPYCGSDEVSKPRQSAAAFAISMLLVGFFLPFIGSRTCHCFDCGEDFKYKNRKKDVAEKAL
jgi:hypothetical protein